jgi:transposase
VLLLDDGLKCEEVAKVLFVDDDTIRSWRHLYEEDGLEGLTRFGAGGSACQLSGEQQDQLKTWVQATLPRTLQQARFHRAVTCLSRALGRPEMFWQHADSSQGHCKRKTDDSHCDNA